MTDPKAHFTEIAPPFMDLLLRDFPVLDKFDAAAVFGNFGHECAGFTKLQEINPTKQGSRGGYGWAQWTGSRRLDYEAYCLRNDKDPAAPASNYAFAFVELTGPEARAIGALSDAPTLDKKVVAFELAFERAGVKHYPSRKQWALIALHAYEAWLDERGLEEDTPEPADQLPAASLPEMATLEAVTRLAAMTPEQLHAAAMTIAMAQAMQLGWRIEDPQDGISGLNMRTPGIAFTQPTEIETMDTKAFYKSKTLIGIVLAAIPTLFPQAAPLVLPLQDLTGVDPQATAAVSEVVDSAMQLVGLLLAAYGTFTRKTTLSVKG